LLEAYRSVIDVNFAYPLSCETEATVIERPWRDQL